MDRTIHPLESAIHPVAFAKHPMKGPACSFRDAPASLEGIRRRASALTLCHITHSRTARHFQPPHSMPRWHHGACRAVVRPPWGRTWGRHAVRGFAMLTRGYRIVRPIWGRQQRGGRTSPPHVPQTFTPTRSRAAHTGPATTRRTDVTTTCTTDFQADTESGGPYRAGSSVGDMRLLNTHHSVGQRLARPQPHRKKIPDGKGRFHRG